MNRTDLARPARPVALKTTDVTVRFGGVIAADQISLEVAQGETLGIIGPNGAGKTTLINAISGLVPLASGHVFVGDKEVSGWRPDKIAGLGVGRTFQAAEVFNDFSVIDYLLLGRLTSQRKSIVLASVRAPSIRQEELSDRQLVTDMLERYGLKSLVSRRLSELPYGLRKLLDLLRACVGNNTLLLVDEPTSGTAISDRQHLREVLADVAAQGAAVVVVDHDVQFITDVCARALAMSYGRELGVGPPAEVLSRADVRAAYVGLEDEAPEPGSSPPA
jgi:branched-chain amino acid transport system ATP-binding protein